MFTTSKSNPGPAAHHDKTLDVVTVGLVALLLLVAATDRRNTVLDTTASRSERIGPFVPPATDAEMVREMLTHD